jgi:hypothetical protein
MAAFGDTRSLAVGAALVIIVMTHFDPSAFHDRQMAQTPSQTSQIVPEEPSTEGPSDQTLSKKLDKSDGLIKPPSRIDPQAALAPPDAGPQSMPVIPPPGSPSSSSPVAPK